MLEIRYFLVKGQVPRMTDGMEKKGHNNNCLKKLEANKLPFLGGDFKDLLFSSLFGEDSHFD